MTSLPNGKKKPHFLNTVLLAKQLPCAISLRLTAPLPAFQTAPPVLVEVGFLLAIQTSAAQCPLINPLDTLLSNSPLIILFSTRR